MDADSKFHPPVIRQGSVLLRQLFLNGRGTIERIHSAGKLSQKIVARRIDNSSVVIFDELADEPAVSGDGLDGGHLIITHQPAVRFHIRAHDGRQFTDNLILVFRHAVKPSFPVLPS